MTTTFRNLTTSEEPDSWHGVQLRVGPKKPGLRMEVTAGSRMRLAQNGRTVLLAEVERAYRKVDFVRTAAYVSPLRQLTAAEARDTPAPRSAAWFARWAHRFGRALNKTDGSPLHEGEWRISSRIGLLTGRSFGDFNAKWPDRILAEHPSGEINWFTSGGGWAILPLRPLAAAESARVKSYAKQIDEGVLPPVLLWWISGLDCHVVLDGHDRLAACLMRGQEPPLLRLHRAVPDSWAEVRHRWVTDLYTRHMDGLDKHDDWPADIRRRHQSGAAQTLAGHLNDAEEMSFPTRAHPLTGGVAAWKAESQRIRK